MCKNKSETANYLIMMSDDHVIVQQLTIYTIMYVKMNCAPDIAHTIQQMSFY